MKKTLTVNLGGTVFNIDEDAYQLLDKYLTNLRIHFRKEEGAEEIMNDFEMRISELFNERIRLGYEVISIEQVEEVIKRMGKPEDIFDNEATKDDNPAGKAGTAASEGKLSAGKKKLMRDPDNRILGGVAGGIAAYMSWDTTAIRLVMIILIFVPYTPIVLLYLILWLVMPQARTAADRLIMRGESVTLENIGKTVTNGFEKISDNVNNYVTSDKPKNILRKLADLFVTVVGFILKFIIILAGICLLPVCLLIIFLLIIITIAFVSGGAGLIQNMPFNMMPVNIPSPFVIIGSLGLLLSFSIPVFALVHAVCVQLFKIKSLSSTAKWTLLILWIIALVLCGIYLYQAGVNGWEFVPFSMSI